MVSTSVIITFSAPSKEEAEAQMATWNLHEGCSVIINITEGLSTTSGTVDSNSNLVLDVPEVPDVPSG